MNYAGMTTPPTAPIVRSLSLRTCPGAHVLHADGTVAGCTLDDEDGCHGRELRHEADPVRCAVWTVGGCERCGVPVPH